MQPVFSPFGPRNGLEDVTFYIPFTSLKTCTLCVCVGFFYQKCFLKYIPSSVILFESLKTVLCSNRKSIEGEWREEKKGRREEEKRIIGRKEVCWSPFKHFSLSDTCRCLSFIAPEIELLSP